MSCLSRRNSNARIVSETDRGKQMAKPWQVMGSSLSKTRTAEQTARGLVLFRREWSA